MWLRAMWKIAFCKFNLSHITIKFLSKFPTAINVDGLQQKTVLFTSLQLHTFFDMLLWTFWMAQQYFLDFEKGRISLGKII